MEETVSGGPEPLQTGLDAGAEASEQLSQAARDASDTVRRTAGDVKDQAVSGMESGKDRASQQFADTADSFHRSAQDLRDRDQTWLAELVDRGAEQLERASETLRSNDLQGLLNQLDSFARRQPALFAGASMIAGFALARMARVALDQSSTSGASTDSPVSGSSPEPVAPGGLYNG